MNKIVFDLETQFGPDEVGGWQNKSKMRVSLLVAYYYHLNEYKTFYEQNITEFIETLNSSELIVGFNIINFDYEVLKRYTNINFSVLPTLDILEDITEQIGYRVNLDNIAYATLGIQKAASGKEALYFWKNKELEKLEWYCKKDVRITHDLYEFGNKNGFLFYFDARIKERNKVKVTWVK